MDRILHIFGAILHLAAYALAQTRVLDFRSYPYLLMNLPGSTLQATVAGAGLQSAPF